MLNNRVFVEAAKLAAALAAQVKPGQAAAGRWRFFDQSGARVIGVELLSAGRYALLCSDDGLTPDPALTRVVYGEQEIDAVWDESAVYVVYVTLDPEYTGIKARYTLGAGETWRVNVWPGGDTIKPPSIKVQDNVSEALGLAYQIIRSYNRTDRKQLEAPAELYYAMGRELVDGFFVKILGVNAQTVTDNRLGALSVTVVAAGSVPVSLTSDFVPDSPPYAFDGFGRACRVGTVYDGRVLVRAAVTLEQNTVSFVATEEGRR